MESEFNELDATNGWALLFQQIRNESSNFDFTMKEAKKTENKNLNRYRDVSPYDHSRVKLQFGDGGDYINASLLDVPDAHRSYILTQGPLPNTTGHFWQMVWERNSKAVLMLNRVIEKNTIKCHQYWPLGRSRDGEDLVELKAVGLTVEYVSESEASYYVLRRLKLTETESGESRIVLHFHYTTWPDFSVPQSPSAFLDFLFAVRDSGALDENVGPPVVHCSAGIGRSGTFCLVDSCLILIEKHRDRNVVDVKKMLLEMRKYRMGLIQTPDQLRFSYLAILEGTRRVLTLEDGIKCNDELKTKSKHLSTDSDKDVDESLTAVKETKDAVDDDDDDEEEEDDEEEDESVVSGSMGSRSSREELLSVEGDAVEEGDVSPPLPPKRRHSSSSSSKASTEGDRCRDQDVPCKRKAALNHTDGLKNNKRRCEGDAEDDDETESAVQENCLMTMKDGAVVTNFGERLREAELRKRQRKERNEKLRDKIKTIQQKQQDSEKWRERRSLFKPISVSLLLILGGGYLVYRYFWKGAAGGGT